LVRINRVTGQVDLYFVGQPGWTHSATK
jgi:hypothetical protein